MQMLKSRYTTTRLEETAGFDMMMGGFQRACHATGGVLTQYLKIGEFVVCLKFAGKGLIPYLGPALEHLHFSPDSVQQGTDGKVDIASEPDLTICLWDSTSTETAPTPLISWLLQSIERYPFKQLSPRQEIKLLSNPRIPASYTIGSNVFSMLDTKKNIALYWVNDATKLPYHEQGAPMRTIFNWWLSSRDYQCVHAGAVGTAEGGVLLTGKGGSGKSTSALSCLDADLLYASDDYCIFKNEPQPYVYSLYNTAKLNGVVDLQRQPKFLPMIHNPEKAGQEKLMLFLSRSMPEKLLPSFPLKAVLLPFVSGKPKTKLSPISSGTALKALAPTSMLQLPGAAQKSFKNMAKLVRQLPCYRLELGTNIKAIPDTILELLAKS